MSKKHQATLRDLVPYLRGHIRVLVLAGGVSLLAAAGMLAQPLLTRSVIDAISESRPVLAPAAGVATLLVFAAILSGVRDYLLRRTGEALVLGLRTRLAAHVLRLPIEEYDQRRTGDLLSRVGADSTLLRFVITSGVFELVTGGLMITGAAVASLMLDPVLFVVTAGGMTLGMLGAGTVARRTRPVSEEAQTRLGEMTSSLERAISSVRTIRAARAEERETETIVHSARRTYVMGLRLAKLQALIAPLAQIASNGVFLLILGVGGARVASGSMSVGDLVAFILFIFFLIMPLGQVISAYSQLQTGMGALQRVEDILRLPTESSREPQRLQEMTSNLRPGANVSPTPAVTFKNVTFGYEADEPILRDVSFSVPVGTRTALVGPSGAGKSTLLALAERFYDVRGGSIEVGGTDIRKMSHGHLRAQIGYVEQEAPVLAGTIRDNLRLAAPEASDERLMEILRTVNLSDIAERSPLGLDAEVGDGGVRLSGGERQRLAIARILLVRPPVLLLDEPTSNLDATNEAAFRRAVDSVADDHTLLIVAHRLSTVVDADQIVVMESGKVAAVGRHEELVATNPLYRDLAAQQLLIV